MLLFLFIQPSWQPRHPALDFMCKLRRHFIELFFSWCKLTLGRVFFESIYIKVVGFCANKDIDRYIKRDAFKISIA